MKLEYKQCEVAEAAIEQLAIKEYIDENGTSRGGENRTPEAILIRRLAIMTHSLPHIGISKEEFINRVNNVIKSYVNIKGIDC